MRRASKLLRIAASSLVAGALVACGGNPEATSGEESQGVTISPPGPKPLPTSCNAVNPSCMTWPRSDAGYSPAYDEVSSGTWAAVSGFSASMTAAGCKPEFYEVSSTDAGDVVAPNVVAYCPTAPPYTRGTLCDHCVQPPTGYVAVTWQFWDPERGQDPVPSPTCDLSTCVTTFHY